MADLKVNSTVGGLPIWHQGNFPLYPINNTLSYKTYKVYTEFDKPQAVDNDFVSKKDGGTYLKPVTLNEGLIIKDSAGESIVIKADSPASSSGATYTASIRLVSQLAFSTADGIPFMLIDPALPETGKPRLIVMGDVVGKHAYDESGRLYSPGNKPDKTVVGLPLVDNAKQVIIDTTLSQNMTGTLSAPNFYSRNPASEPDHTPRLDQVVVRGAIQDFGTY